MRVRNPNARQSAPQLVAALQAYMQNRPEASEEEIRRDVPGFDTLTKGGLHQVALDAGFKVEPDTDTRRTP